MNTKAFLAAPAAALILSGCAWFKLAPPVGTDTAGESWPPGATLWRSAAAVEADEVLALLGYYQRMLGASAEDQRKELNSVGQVFARDKTESARFRLALLLSLPNAALRDDARLTNLLENSPSRSAPPESARRQLLTLLTRLTAERQRQTGQLREEHKKLEAQVKDEQKRADEQQKRADEVQKRADELQEKLDKLLAIERELRARTPRRQVR